MLCYICHMQEFLNPDYLFDLKGLWEVFRLQPSFNKESQTIEVEYDGAELKVGFMEFVVNHNLNDVIADSIHVKSYGVGWPFAAGEVLKGIEELSNYVKALGYKFDIFQYKKDLLLDSWLKQVNPQTEQTMIDEFKYVLKQNIEFHLSQLKEDIENLNPDRLIKTELNQNALAFVFMLMVGKSALKEGNKSKSWQYDDIANLFVHYLKFKDERTGEYKEINKTNFLKKVSAVRKKERDRDRMKEDFNYLFDELFKSN
jgi:hypothetical protein